MKSPFSALLLFSLLVLAKTATADVTVEVSPGISPQAALEKVRELRKNGDTGPATITFPAGPTDLRQPLVLEAQDSDLTFSGAGATVLGSLPVKDWQPHEGAIMKAEIGKVLPRVFFPSSFCVTARGKFLPAIRITIRRILSTVVGLSSRLLPPAERRRVMIGSAPST